MTIKIGTRGSKLALWQAYFVEEKLKAAGITTEIITFETKGDKILDKALSKIGSKGLFTEELENSLHAGEIDIAVHSAKDLPSDLGPDLSILAFTEREESHDVLISKKDLDLEQPIVIGTSSTRRVAMLKAYFPDYKTVDMRGNLQTRISKLERGDCDALMLAYAGVHRMGYQDMILADFELEKITPAVGQGSIAIEHSNGLAKDKISTLKKILNHQDTETCLLTERSFLKTMNGGCSIPVFGHAHLDQDGFIHLNAGIIKLNGEQIIRVKSSGKNPEALGKLVAEKILKEGGREILAEIRNELNH